MQPENTECRVLFFCIFLGRKIADFSFFFEGCNHHRLSMALHSLLMGTFWTPVKGTETCSSGMTQDASEEFMQQYKVTVILPIRMTQLVLDW